MIENQIRDFYSKIGFPGNYTLDDLKFYDDYNDNTFLKPYIDKAQSCNSVLDIGCGTGFITNLLARKYKHLKIDAVDFCDSIDYAKEFSKVNGIKNVKYYKTNFFDFDTVNEYDLIISNGVLHHMPEYKKAIDKITSYNSDNLVIGIYNKYGKLYKKILPVTYKNELLYKDQEEVPFELSFTHNEFVKLFPNYKLVSPKKFVDLLNLFNYKQGGLTVYTFTKDY